jgi:hypothetical protein
VAPREGGIRELVLSGRWELSRHAERERQADKIFLWEIEAALIDCEVIEDYPDDQRGPSFLTLGFARGRPIHIVGTIRNDFGELLLITIYDPSKSPQVWTEDYRKRKE